MSNYFVKGYHTINQIQTKQTKNTQASQETCHLSKDLVLILIIFSKTYFTEHKGYDNKGHSKPVRR